MSNKTRKISLVTGSVAALAFSIVAIQPNTYGYGTTVSSTVSPSITAESNSATVNINTTPGPSPVQTINNDAVSVSTNDTAGYTLKIAASGASSALTSGANTIPTSTGTQASPVAMAANTWGYHVDTVGGFGTGPTSAVSNQAIGALTFAGLPATASPNTLKTTAATASSDVTNVWYGVAVNNTQPASATPYTVGITYTITAN